MYAQLEGSYHEATSWTKYPALDQVTTAVDSYGIVTHLIRKATALVVSFESPASYTKLLRSLNIQITGSRRSGS